MKVLDFLSTPFFRLEDVEVEVTNLKHQRVIQGYAETKIDRVPVTVFFTIEDARGADIDTLYINVCPAGTSEDDTDFEDSIVTFDFKYGTLLVKPQ